MARMGVGEILQVVHIIRALLGCLDFFLPPVYFFFFIFPTASQAFLYYMEGAGELKEPRAKVVCLKGAIFSC